MRALLSPTLTSWRVFSAGRSVGAAKPATYMSSHPAQVTGPKDRSMTVFLGPTSRMGSGHSQRRGRR